MRLTSSGFMAWLELHRVEKADLLASPGNDSSRRPGLPFRAKSHEKGVSEQDPPGEKAFHILSTLSDPHLHYSVRAESCFLTADPQDTERKN